MLLAKTYIVQKLQLPFFFIGTIIMIVVMARTGAALKTPATPKGILDLEFAYSIEKVNVVMNAWHQKPDNIIDNRSIARVNTYFDFIFIFFYSGFLFLACKRIARTTNTPFLNSGNKIAYAAITAGILDILENTGMLISLNGNISAAVSFLTTFFSAIKWILALIAVLYVLAGIIILGWRRIKS
jgi:hypothetical protein